MKAEKAKAAAEERAGASEARALASDERANTATEALEAAQAEVRGRIRTRPHTHTPTHQVE